MQYIKYTEVHAKMKTKPNKQKNQTTYLNSVIPSCIAATAFQSFSQVDYREGSDGLIQSLAWLFSSISFMINVHL